MLLYQLTRSPIHRKSNRQFGDPLSISLKSQESYLDRLVLYLDKVGNPPSEADQVSLSRTKTVLSLRNKLKIGIEPMLILTRSLKIRSGRRLSMEIYQNIGVLDSENDFDRGPGCGCTCHVNRNINSLRL